MFAIIDKGLSTEKQLPFTHITSNFNALTLTFATDDPEKSGEIDIDGLDDLHFSTIEAKTEKDVPIPIAGTYNHVASVSSSYSVAMYTLQVVFDFAEVTV